LNAFVDVTSTLGISSGISANQYDASFETHTQQHLYLTILLRAISITNPLPVLAAIGGRAVSNIQGAVLFLVAMSAARVNDDIMLLCATILSLNPIPLMTAAGSGIVLLVVEDYQQSIEYFFTYSQ